LGEFAEDNTEVAPRVLKNGMVHVQRPRLSGSSRLCARERMQKKTGGCSRIAHCPERPEAKPQKRWTTHCGYGDDGSVADRGVWLSEAPGVAARASRGMLPLAAI
jgi:hypothetical protein